MTNEELPPKPPISSWENRLFTITILCLLAASVYVVVERGNYHWDQWSLVLVAFMLVLNNISFKFAPASAAGKMMRSVGWSWMILTLGYFICVVLWGS